MSDSLTRPAARLAAEPGGAPVWRGVWRGLHRLDHPVALALYAALAWALYLPPPGWTTDYILGSPADPDPWAFVWFLDWWPLALERHLSPLRTDLVDAPVGTLLAWRTSVPAIALLAAPATRAWGALAVYNAAMLAAPALAAWTTWLAARELTRSRPAAFVAGLVFGFSPYEIGQLVNHLNLAFTAAVPLLVWAALRAQRRGWSVARTGVALGGLLTIQFGVSQEIFATSCIFALIAGALLWRAQPTLRPALRRTGAGALLGLGLATLLLSPLLWGMLTQFGTSAGRIAKPASLVNDVLGLILPPPTAWLSGPGAAFAVAIARRSDELVGYVGAPLLLWLLAIHRARAARPEERALVQIAAVAAIASFGPYLNLAGIAIGTAPWIVFAHLPLFGAILPARLILFGWLAVAMLLALWLSRPAASPRRAAIAALALLPLIPSPGFARLWSPVIVPDIVRARSLPADSRVMFLPDFAAAVRYQSVGGLRFRLVGQGYLGAGEPEPFARWTLFGALAQDQPERIDPRAFAAYLAEYGADRVVVLKPGFVQKLRGGDADRAAQAERLLRAAGWELAQQSEDTLVFRPPAQPAPPATAEAVAGWMQRAEVERLARRIRIETNLVCDVRRLAAPLGIDPAAPLRLYAWVATPPRPIGEIGCGR